MGIVDFFKGKDNAEPESGVSEMTFEEVMEDIKSGLTGDPKKDKPYVQLKMQQYKNHKDNLKIMGKCGELLGRMMPEEEKKKVAEHVRKNAEAIEKTIDVVKFNMYKRNFDDAVKIMDELIAKIDAEADAYMEHSDNIYIDVDEFLEFILYQVYEKPEGMIRRPLYRYHYIYKLYGSLLFEVKNFDKAKIYLEKSLKWNPMSVSAAFELGELLKINKDMEGYYQANKDIYNKIFRRADMARYLRNIAFYFVEKELYEVAAACLYVSLSFADTDMAKSELFYIGQKSGKNISAPDVKDLEQYSEKYGIMFRPCPQVVVHALSFAKFALANNDMNSVKYLIKTVYDYLLPDSVKAKKEAENADAGSIKYQLNEIYEITHLSAVKEMYDEIADKDDQN